MTNLIFILNVHSRQCVEIMENRVHYDNYDSEVERNLRIFFNFVTNCSNNEVRKEIPHVQIAKKFKCNFLILF